MSQEDVEGIRALIAHWNAGDRDLRLLSKHVDPAIELESPFASIAGEPYRGYAGIEQWMRDVDEQFADWVIAVDDARDLDGMVITIGTISARGRASGAAFEFAAASVSEFASDHRITRLRLYLDVEEALRSVGLEE